MILTNLFTFAVVFLAIWVNMAIVKAILGIWLDDEKATLAAFAYSVGTLAGLRPPLFEDHTKIGMLAAMLVGYLGLWWVHFGRARWEAAHR